MTRAKGNILLLKNRAIGDSLMGLSSVSYLKELFPDKKIYYALPEWILPLYEHSQTDVEEFIPISFKSLGKALWQKNIGTIIELNQRGSSAKLCKVLSLMFRVEYVFHNHHLKKSSIVDQGVILPSIQRDLDGIYSWSKSSDRPSFKNYLPKFCPPQKKKDFIVFGLSASRATKRYSVENFISLAQKISRKIIVPLGPQENELAEKISAQKNIEVIQGPLNELPLKIQGAKYYLGNDTGLKHLCVAMNIPTVTFFGPENPSEWHPYKDDRHTFFFDKGLECRTRQSHYCALQTCSQWICLNFDPELVFNHLVNQGLEH